MPHRNFVLVEDNDDFHVLRNLCGRRGILSNTGEPDSQVSFAIKRKDGVENIIETLDVEVDASGLENLGIIVDADLNINARWQAIAGKLQLLGYNAPAKPDTEGTIVELAGRPRIGVWIMPDNRLPGMLEDFVGFLGADADPLWAVAGNCLDGIPTEDRRFAPIHRSKAHIHTWLAWQQRPGLPFGQAITSRYLNADAPHAERLVDWIRKLFSL